MSTYLRARCALLGTICLQMLLIASGQEDCEVFRNETINDTPLNTPMFSSFVYECPVDGGVRPLSYNTTTEWLECELLERPAVTDTGNSLNFSGYAMVDKLGECVNEVTFTISNETFCRKCQYREIIKVLPPTRSYPKSLLTSSPVGQEDGNVDNYVMIKLKPGQDERFQLDLTLTYDADKVLVEPEIVDISFVTTTESGIDHSPFNPSYVLMEEETPTSGKLQRRLKIVPERLPQGFLSLAWEVQPFDGVYAYNYTTYSIELEESGSGSGSDSDSDGGGAALVVGSFVLYVVLLCLQAAYFLIAQHSDIM